MFLDVPLGSISAAKSQSVTFPPDEYYYEYYYFDEAYDEKIDEYVYYEEYYYDEQVLIKCVFIFKFD